MEDIKKSIYKKNDFKTVTGKVMGHKRGFGFLETETGETIYLPHGVMKKVFHGDSIKVNVKDVGNGKNIVELIEIVEIENKRMFGKVTFVYGQYYITPDHHRFYHSYFIPKYATRGAKDGDYVVFDRIDVNDNRCKLKVFYILGKSSESGFENKYALIANGLFDFNYEIGKGEEGMISHFPEGYKDFRDINFFTIDSEYSNDLDDAISVSTTKDGWSLKVAIADVSFHVKRGTDLDHKAASLGQTVYMPGMSVSMFPDHLVSGSLSLLPMYDRLALVMSCDIDKDGVVSNDKFEFGVISSKAKLSYSEVTSYIEGDNDKFKERYPTIFNSINDFYDLYEVLNKFYKPDFYEESDPQIVIDFNTKKAIDIRKYRSGISSKMIEIAMILHNYIFAKKIKEANLKGPFRTHGGLDMDKEDEAEWFMGMLLQRKAEDLNSYDTYKDLKAYLSEQTLGCHYVYVMNGFINAAKYSTTPEKHFGLGFDAYMTASSPIRKYSDLIAQRVMRGIIFGDSSYVVSEEELSNLNYAITKARDTSRLSEKMFKIQYTEDVLLKSENKDKIYESEIIAIDRNGFMVSTIEHGIVGYIHKGFLKTGGEGYVYDYALKWAEEGEEKYFIGKKINVKIKSVYRQSQVIEVEIVE